MGHCHCASYQRTVGWDKPRGEKPLFLAISMAGKVVVDCVRLYVVVIRVGHAAEYSRFSLGDPSL
jgi:hypothetical protein